MQFMKKWRFAVVVLAIALLGAACSLDDAEPDETTQSESKSRDDGYQALVAAEPAKRMTNPVTRETINFWIDTWNTEGQLAFVYILGATGEQIGYYVLQGPPVSMCTALTPTWRFEQRDLGDVRGDVMVQAPGVDGVYYSGGECQAYYGKDASTGAYVEFTIGGGINYFLSTQPLPVDSKPLGFTSTAQVQEQGDKYVVAPR